MRPEFGCGVHDFVFDSIDANTIGSMEEAIREALDALGAADRGPRRALRRSSRPATAC